MIFVNSVEPSKTRLLEIKIIFEEPDLCVSFGNEFYNLSSTRLAVAAVENICIAGISSNVVKIMVYLLNYEKFRTKAIDKQSY